MRNHAERVEKKIDERETGKDGRVAQVLIQKTVKTSGVVNMKGERWKRQAKGGNMKDEDKSELRGEGEGAQGKRARGQRLLPTKWSSKRARR